MSQRLQSAGQTILDTVQCNDWSFPPLQCSGAEATFNVRRAANLVNSADQVRRIFAANLRRMFVNYLGFFCVGKLLKHYYIR